MESIIYRYGAGIVWRDLLECFGPWQTVWKRHRRFSGDATWDEIHSVLLAYADAVGLIDWEVSVDSTINRAHQFATNLARDTAGFGELHDLRPEPTDHAVGRSRGGLSTTGGSTFSQKELFV